MSLNTRTSCGSNTEMKLEVLIPRLAREDGIESSRCAREPCAQGKLHGLTQGNGILIPRWSHRAVPYQGEKEEEEEARQPASRLPTKT